VRLVNIKDVLVLTLIFKLFGKSGGNRMARKKDKFAVYLSNIAINLKESANYFADYKLKNVSDLKIFSEKMKEYENKGDDMVHEVIKELHNAFITYIEREDILTLTMSMDDVLDGLEHTAALFEMYSIVDADDYMLRFVDAIRSCASEIETAVDLLAAKKLLNMREHAIKIKDLESKCDGILRESIKHLFVNEKDPIRIIQYKEIYEELENIADFCQSVANTLETIIMKNA
jgi:predicted phosphate transport protein (TIGR00153 family)